MIGVQMAFDGFRKKFGRKLSVRTYLFFIFCYQELIAVDFAIKMHVKIMYSKYRCEYNIRR
jgi:hypothetical protein